jgi:hypothetical protein
VLQPERRSEEEIQMEAEPVDYEAA